MADFFKLAMIGLDTSHTVSFTKLIQGPLPVVEELRVVKALRFSSVFQDEAGQDARQADLEALRVEVTDDFDTAAADVDGFCLELNDAGMHRDYFERVAPLGKPVFVDKPFAASFQDAKAILALAERHGVRVFSSSSLRWSLALQKARKQVTSPDSVALHGPLNEAPRGSSLLWYGVHVAEMLVTVLGPHPREVLARETDRGVCASVHFRDGAWGLLDISRNTPRFGGWLYNDASYAHFVEDDVMASYRALVRQLRAFFCENRQPVPHAETLAMQAIIDAIAHSCQTGDLERLHL